VTDSFQTLADGPEPRALGSGLWLRRAIVALLALVVALALLDVFGQRATTSSAASDGATLQLRAPSTVRGGLLFQSRIVITARHTLDHPRLILDRGWFEGMQVNSITPQPVGQDLRDGDRVVLSFSSLDAGATLTVWLQFQVDPTNIGRRAYGVELDDAEQPVAHVSRKLTVLP